MLKIKNRIKILLKLIVSFGLLGYLALLIDFERAVSSLKGIDILSIIVVPLITLTGVWFASLRWQLVLADNYVKLPMLQAYRGYLFGIFYGNILPGMVGGETIRIGLCVKRTKCGVQTALASVLIERIYGALALIAMICFVFLIFPPIGASLLNSDNASLIFALGFSGILGMALMLIGCRVWIRCLPREGDKRVWSIIRGAMQNVVNLKGRTWGLLLILSLLCQSADVVAAFFLCRAIKLGLPLAVFFAIVPLVCLSSLLPISLGGLGVREGAMVFLLSGFGVLTSDAVTLSLLIYLNRMVIGTIGGFLQLTETLTEKLIPTV